MAITAGLQVTFNVATKKFEFLDETNLTGGTTFVKGVLKITYPSGAVVYTGDNDSSTFANPALSTTPDFTSSGSTNTSVSIPLSNTGVPQVGDYIFEYRVAGSGDLLSNISPINICFTYISPKVAISQDYDCFVSNFVSTDLTDYKVAGYDPSTKTITHTLTYPAGAPITNVVDSTTTITRTYTGTDGLFIGKYRSDISTALIYQFPGFQIKDEVIGTAQVVTECSVQYCALYCILKTLRKDYDKEANSNPTIAAQKKADWEECVALFQMYIASIKCKDTKRAEEYANKIYDISGADQDGDCGCGCGDSTTSSTPTLIVPFESNGSSSGTSSVLFGKTTFVDAGEGDDNTAEFNNLAKKYKTIQAGLVNTLSGGECIVYAGDYSEVAIGKANTTLTLNNGVTVNQSNGTNPFITGSLSGYRVFGGKIQSSVNNILNNVQPTTTPITFDVDEINTLGNFDTIIATNGDIIIRAKKITSASTDITKFIGKFLTAANVTIYADEIIGNELGEAFNITGGSLTIYANKIIGKVSALTNSNVKIYGAEITFNSSTPMNVTTAGSVLFDNCKIVNTNTSAAAHTVKVLDSAIFKNTLIKCNAASGGYAVTADSNQTILIQGDLCANKDKNTNISIAGGTFNYDTDFDNL